MTINLNRLLKSFGGGTISCAIAHNLTDPTAVVDLATVEEASKTGAVAAVLALLLEASKRTKDSPIETE